MLLEQLEAYLRTQTELATIPICALIVPPDELSSERSTAISISVAGQQKLPSYNGTLELNTSAVTLNCFTRKYGDLVGLTEVILRALDGYAGPMGTLQALRSKVVSTIETTNNTNPIIYQGIFLIEITT